MYATEDLGGIHEIAVMMGRSKQRVHQLAGKEWWPRPLVRLKMGPVYSMESVRRALREHGRDL